MLQKPNTVQRFALKVPKTLYCTSKVDAGINFWCPVQRFWNMMFKNVVQGSKNWCHIAKTLYRAAKIEAQSSKHCVYHQKWSLKWPKIKIASGVGDFLLPCTVFLQRGINFCCPVQRFWTSCCKNVAQGSKNWCHIVKTLYRATKMKEIAAQPTAATALGCYSPRCLLVPPNFGTP